MTRLPDRRPQQRFELQERQQQQQHRPPQCRPPPSPLLQRVSTASDLRRPCSSQCRPHPSPLLQPPPPPLPSLPPESLLELPQLSLPQPGRSARSASRALVRTDVPCVGGGIRLTPKQRTRTSGWRATGATAGITSTAATPTTPALSVGL